MKYELKSIAPLSVLLNALRIFTVVGFLVAIKGFFIMPNPTVRFSTLGHKLIGTLVFTVVYGVVVALISALVAWLYNIFAANFKGISVRFEQNND
jgi:hypothetical protein